LNEPARRLPDSPIIVVIKVLPTLAYLLPTHKCFVNRTLGLAFLGGAQDALIDILPMTPERVLSAIQKA